jgi:hypothetical protein
MKVRKSFLVVCLVLMTLCAAICSWLAHREAERADFWEHQWKTDR